MPGLVLLAVFFGDLHIHTAISSDAVGDPAQLFDVARNEENLDFIAITDHDTTIDPAEWDLTRDLASAANVPGVFVAFSGIEWTQGVHIAVYFLNDDEPFCPTCNDLPRFYAFYGPTLSAHAAGAHIAHPNNQGSFSILDDSVLANVEIWNGRHESFDQEYGSQGAVALLAQGNRLGFVGVSDDHSFDGTGEHSRRLGETLTGCHAASLTRASILQALRERRCFATDNLRTVVDLDVNGAPMGGATGVCEGASFDVALHVSGTATPSLVEIVQDGVPIASRSDCVSADCDLATRAVASGPFSNVYGRVSHDPSTGCANCRTWSSPVRVDTSAGVGCAPDVPALGEIGRVVLILAMTAASGLALWSLGASRPGRGG
jgi:hypothetical protein